MQIKIVTKVLSDGSKVYDVLLIRDHAAVRLNAVSYEDAFHLESAILGAVEAYTVNLVA